MSDLNFSKKKNSDLNLKKVSQLKSKSNHSLYSIYYAKACIEFVGNISASLRPGNTASFEEMSQWW